MKELRQLSYGFFHPLVGWDPVAHVVCGWTFTNIFGWWGIPISFTSHFLVDAIPHGHLEETLPEISKGFVLTIFLILWILLTDGFWLAVCVGLNVLSALLFDVFQQIAEIVDKKKTHLKLAKKILGLNYFFHWFGKCSVFSSFWKDPTEHSCGLKGNGLEVAEYNLLHLILILFLSKYMFGV